MFECIGIRRSMINNNSKTRKLNETMSRVLIVTVFIILAVHNVESMPSREFQQSHSSSSYPDLHNVKDEFSGILEDEKNKSESQDSKLNEGRESTKERTTSTGDRDAIQYPGAWQKSIKNFVPKPLPDCEGKTFCEETASSYPQEYLSNVITNTESLKLFSGVDQIDVVQRVDSADGGELLCGSEIKIVYPKTARNGDNEWLFVIQDEAKGYKQGVKIENCDVGTAEGTCKIIEGSIFGYKTYCKQKYVSRVMAAVHRNGTAVTENFSMPSSCCCQLKIIGDGVASRLGGNTPKNQTPAPRKTRRNR